MKTSTEHITLSPGLDDTQLSTQCLSALIDTWLELQTSAVEAVQAPTPNLFSFAESCFFFAVILLNEPSDSGREGTNDPLEKNGEEFNRAVNRSVLDARARSQGSASSSTVVHADDATNIRGHMFMDIGAEGAGSPFDHDPESYNWRETSRYRVAHTDDTASDRTLQSPNYNIWASPVPNPSPNTSQGKVRPSVLQDTRGNSLLPSSSGQVESSSYPLITHDSPSNHAYSVPYVINTTEQKKAIGIVYLTSTSHDNVPAGEANIGIILTPEARGKGFARQAIGLVLSWVFEEIGFHRVQACILDNDNKDRAISVFTQL
jgi:RimJ/RimL family protein N-acetyltransferase